MYATGSFKYRGSRGGETVISVNPSAFFALWPCSEIKVVRCNGVEHLRNLYGYFRAIKIATPARRGGEKGVKIRLCTSQRAVPI